MSSTTTSPASSSASRGRRADRDEGGRDRRGRRHGLRQGIDHRRPSGLHRTREEALRARTPEPEGRSNGHGTHVAGSVLMTASDQRRPVRGTAPRAVVLQSLLDARDGPAVAGRPARSLRRPVHQRPGARAHELLGQRRRLRRTTSRRSRSTISSTNRDLLICSRRERGKDGNADGRVDACRDAARHRQELLTVGACETVVRPSTTPTATRGRRIFRRSDPHGPDRRQCEASWPSAAGSTNDAASPDVVAPGSYILSTRCGHAIDRMGRPGRQALHVRRRHEHGDAARGRVRGGRGRSSAPSTRSRRRAPRS